MSLRSFVPRSPAVPRGIRFALLALALLVGAGCARDVGDIDRTQPDKIEKSIFEGDQEWYYRQTVIDTSPGSDSGKKIDRRGRVAPHQRPVWTGMASTVKRIQWEIHEEILYGRATVSPVEGLTEGKDGAEHKEKGIVAAFPIESHFDVQRQYNSGTGEPTNVIVENRTDRPWYEREYMRVDWSQNLVASTGSIGFGIGELSPREGAETVRSIPQKNGRANPKRTRIGEDYIEAVTQYVFDPDLLACSSQFGADSIMRCEGVTATVRNSFWKVPEENDYAPMQYRDDAPLTEEGSSEPIRSANTIKGGQFVEAKCTDAVVQKNKDELQQPREEACGEASFGYFDRYGFIRMNIAQWDPERETYDSGRRQYAARRDIWETAYDEEGDRLPLSDREPEPIVFHLNVAYPRSQMTSAEMVEREWDEAFTEAVRLAKGFETDEQVAERLREGGHEHGQMFVIKKNSCHPGPIVDWLADFGAKREADRDDPRAIVRSHLDGSTELTGQGAVDRLWEVPTEERRRLCAELEWATAPRGDNDAAFSWERYGDMRHSFYAWIDDFNTVGWLGVVVPAIDPKTGEMLNASANIAGRLIEPGASRIAEMARYMNGDLSLQEIKTGDHVRRQQQSDGAQTARQGLKAEGSGASRLDGILAGKENPSLHPDLTDSTDEERTKTARDFGVAPEVIRREAGRTVAASARADQPDGDVIEWLERSDVKERLMANPMVQQTVRTMAVEQHGPQAADDSDATHQAYLDLMAPRLQESTLGSQERLFSSNHILSARAGRRMGEGIAVMMGASEQFEGKSHQELVDFAAKHLTFGVGAHELGHAFGLEHNFAASMDPLNYQKAYWRLERLKLDCSGSEAPECDDGQLTDAEARHGSAQLAREVLDDPDAEYVNQAELRSGSIMDYTPRMAMKPGLGRYDQAAINFAYARHVQQWSDEVPLPDNLQRSKRRTHYTDLPALFGDPDSPYPGVCFGADSDDKTACRKRGIERILEGREWVKISEARRDYRQRLEHNTELVAEGSNADPKVDRSVDFRYCTDDRRGRYLGCEVFDWGANQVEMLAYSFERFRLLEPFYRYRGADIGADSNSQIRGYARALRDTLSRADTPFRYHSFYDTLDYNVGAFTEDLEAAARMGLNFYAETLTRPAPKRYCKYQQGDLSAEHSFMGQARDLEEVFVPSDVYRRDGSLGRCDESFWVDPSNGQFFAYDWSDEYNYRVNRVGTFIDKTLAAGRMFQMDANLTFSQFITDQRASNISYWTEFPDELYRLVHGAFLGDYGDFGGGRDPDDGSYQPYKMVEVHDSASGEGDPMPDDLQTVYDPTSFDIRMRMLVNALSSYSSWEDQKVDFDEYLVVAATEKERQNLPDDLPADDKTTFVHPTTHRTYVAIRAADGKSITYDLVEWANELKARMQTAEQNGESARAAQVKEAMENVVAKLNLIRQARSQLSPEG